MLSKYLWSIYYSRKVPFHVLACVLIPIVIYWLSLVNSYVLWKSIVNDTLPSTLSTMDNDIETVITYTRTLMVNQNKAVSSSYGTVKVEAKSNHDSMSPQLKTMTNVLKNNHQPGHTNGVDAHIGAKDKESTTVKHTDGTSATTTATTTQRMMTNDTKTMTSNKETVSEEELERYYFTPHETKINPIHADFIIDGKQICATKAEYMNLLILVPTLPKHTSMRKAIRSTFGSFVNHGLAIGQNKVNVTVRLAFLVGKDNETNSDSIIRAESKKHGDLVYADFVENYRNLTLKMLIGLKWVSQYCNDISFVLKVDEDVFVHLPRLVTELHKHPYGSNGSVYGHLHVHSPVYRDGKWAITKEEFALPEYPTYAVGNSYIISGNVIPRMAKVAEYLPSLTIEDAFITGCVGKVLGVDKINLPGFTYWHEKRMSPCDFVHSDQITITKVTPQKMYQYWNASSNNSDIC